MSGAEPSLQVSVRDDTVCVGERRRVLPLLEGGPGKLWLHRAWMWRPPRTSRVTLNCSLKKAMMDSFESYFLETSGNVGSLTRGLNLKLEYLECTDLYLG